MGGAFRDYAILAVLAVWLIASIMAQSRESRLLKTRWRDFLGLLPNYRFFAPEPISFDHKIVYRVLVNDLEAGPWSPLSIPPRHRHSWVWNPHQRLATGVNDVVNLLFRYAQDPFWLSRLHVSLPYILILNHLSALVRVECRETIAASEKVAIEFAITRAPGFENNQELVVFKSYAHRVLRHTHPV